jgi:hypothetical protein
MTKQLSLTQATSTGRISHIAALFDDNPVCRQGPSRIMHIYRNGNSDRRRSIIKALALPKRH